MVNPPTHPPGGLDTPLPRARVGQSTEGRKRSEASRESVLTGPVHLGAGVAAATYLLKPESFRDAAFDLGRAASDQTGHRITAHSAHASFRVST